MTTTQPLAGILDPELRKAEIRELRELACPLLREVVNYGTNAFGRTFGDRDRREPEFAVGLSYLHVLEMLDGVEVNLAQAIVFPAMVLLRSAFEGVLAIDYLLEKDLDKRGYAYLVTDVLERIASYRGFMKTTAEGARIRRALSATSFAKPFRLPAIPDLRQRISKLERALVKPGFNEAHAEFRRMKKADRHRPAWHRLYDGPSTIEELALAVKAGPEYEFLYRPWSKTAHAKDLPRQMTTGEGGRAAVRVLRDTGEFASVANLAVTFGIRTTRVVLNRFRPGEASPVERWYMAKVRDRYLRLL